MNVGGVVTSTRTFTCRTASFDDHVEILFGAHK